MLNEIKEYMSQNNLAMLSFGEARKVERYVEWLVDHCEEQQKALATCNCDKTCDCNHTMFHIHTKPACTCGLGPEHCGC